MSSFVSEFMVLAGWGQQPVRDDPGTGMVLSAVHILKLIALDDRPIGDEVAQAFEGNDLNWLEKLAMVPLIGYLLFFGFLPNPAVSWLSRRLLRRCSRSARPILRRRWREFSHDHVLGAC